MERRGTVRNWFICSLVLSALALITLGLLLCRNAGWLPDGTLLPLRVAAVATSTVAGLVGLFVFVALDMRGRTRDAWIAGALAFLAGLPALAVIWHVIYTELRS
jgi:hypothetical protein